ncbi:MAG: hypothetical protein QXT00_03790 [Ignisphaera sp.]
MPWPFTLIIEIMLLSIFLNKFYSTTIALSSLIVSPLLTIPDLLDNFHQY